MIIGGGHNKIETDVPLANFLMATGYKDVDAEFGLLTGGSCHDKRAVYFPRKVSVSLILERQILQETFGQGDVSFVVQPVNENQLYLDFEYDVFSMKKVFVQLPLIVFYNSKVFVDGKLIEHVNLG